MTGNNEVSSVQWTNVAVLELPALIRYHPKIGNLMAASIVIFLVIDKC
jgi:hypothetical protein